MHVLFGHPYSTVLVISIAFTAALKSDDSVHMEPIHFVRFGLKQQLPQAGKTAVWL